MLTLTVLPLLVLLAAGAAEAGGVTCTSLHPLDSICATAGEGFSFSDGCNRVRCLAGGLAASSRRRCPTEDPLSAKDRSQCVSVGFAIFDRVPPRSCPNASPESVCRPGRGGGGFRFTDGCNMIACSEDGSVVGVTRRSCPAGESDSAFCRFIERLNEESAEQGPPTSGKRGSMRRRRRNFSQEFACPRLAAERICDPATNGFTYSDGCNTVTCHADGTGQTTFKACPRPDEAGDRAAAAAAYCESAERQMRAKMQRASLRRRCLQPETVCVADAVRRRQVFNDGCNRCVCRALGEASCTRRSCPALLMTEEEFRGYCERRGADRH
ncbi:hypothetical protein BOX15_Mlig001679g1 [Macrostomum lignano]|uniref:Pacifastin domain-containing protein n=2 Tax=Macrostomum lignano TaxID=282301 RepID=A0A1I8G3C6_9PLAT|nr:hypothetical protein BOX15_Mlig001679g3 [Macrostomum lignano]PAA61914.1 hypothetical protein BOX15_Mlig001679g1 [Macrostomum lignano]